MATLTAAAWTCFMEWKEVLRISVWAIMHTKQQKTKTKGRKRHIQVCELSFNTSWWLCCYFYCSRECINFHRQIQNSKKTFLSRSEYQQFSDNELQLCCKHIKSQVRDDFHVNKKRYFLTGLSFNQELPRQELKAFPCQATVSRTQLKLDRVKRTCQEYKAFPCQAGRRIQANKVTWYLSFC